LPKLTSHNYGNQKFGYLLVCFITRGEIRRLLLLLISLLETCIVDANLERKSRLRIPLLPSHSVKFDASPEEMGLEFLGPPFQELIRHILHEIYNRLAGRFVICKGNQKRTGL